MCFPPIVCPVVRAQRMYLRIDRFNFYGMPRQPVSIVHCALLIGYQVDQYAYHTRTAFKSQEYIKDAQRKNGFLEEFAQ